MRIKMKSTAAGPAGTFVSGLEYEVPDAFGVALCDGGHATPVRVRRETAMVAPDETAQLTEQPDIDPAVLAEIDERYGLDNLASVDDKELLKIPGVGKATVKAIRAWLEG